MIKILKSRFTKLATALTLCITGLLSFSTIQEAHASDRAYYTHTFPSGHSLGAYSWFNYPDVNCGANSYIQYSGAASPAISSMTLSYDAYNVTGAKQFSDSITRSNTTGISTRTPTGVLEKSVSTFTFKHGGSEWQPIQRIYHCAFTSMAMTESTVMTESTKSTMPMKYKNIIKNNAFEETKNIIEQDYSKDIKSFTINNRTLDITDFKLDKKEQKRGFEFSDGEMGYKNPVETNFSYISISVPQKVEKDGTYYKIKAHILVNDTNGYRDSVNTSLYFEPVK